MLSACPKTVALSNPSTAWVWLCCMFSAPCCLNVVHCTRPVCDVCTLRALFRYTNKTRTLEGYRGICAYVGKPAFGE